MKTLLLTIGTLLVLNLASQAGYAYDQNGNCIWYGQSGHWANLTGPDGSYGTGWRNESGDWDWTITVPEPETDSECEETGW